MPVTIGAAKLENVVPGSKKHIEGDAYPMYGKIKGLDRGTPPDIEMHHLAALVAIKVVNQGDAPKNDLTANRDGKEQPIIIKEITFSVPTISTTINDKTVKQTALPIVGTFNVDVTDDVSAASFTPVSGATSVTIPLSSSVKIDPGKDTTFYLAVRPFDATNNKDELKFTNKTAITLDISINGSKRSVEIPADTKFEAGKVTTLRVPVKLSYPKESKTLSDHSDVFYLSSGVSEEDLNVNGEQLKAYIIPKGEKVTIEGTVKNLLELLSAGFYVSYWNEQPSAMTVNLIDLYMPVEGGHDQIAYYSPFQEQMKSSLKPVIESIPLLGNAVKIGIVNYDKLWSPGLNLSKYNLGDDVCLKNLVIDMLKDGIPRDNSSGGMIYLTRFIAPETITFSAILENGADSEADPILILDEAPIFKEVGETQINNLFATKFTYNNYIPTYEEFSDAVLTGNCNDSIKTIWAKLKSSVGDKKAALGSLAEIEIWPIFTSIFSGPEDLAAKLGAVKIRVEIATCSPTGASTSHPIVLWGVNNNL